MATNVDIPPLAFSAYDAADDEKLRTILDELVKLTAQSPIWTTRTQTLLEIIGALDDLSASRGDGADDDEENGDGEDEEFDPEEYFLESLPMYLAAILERLAETKITCADQAAFYLLSAHPEHQEAAQAWLDADEDNESAFEAFVQSHDYYRSLLDRGFEAGMTEEE